MCKSAFSLWIFLVLSKRYFLNDGFLQFYDIEILCFEGWSVLFLIEIWVVFVHLYFSLLIFFALDHFKVELILIF